MAEHHPRFHQRASDRPGYFEPHPSQLKEDQLEDHVTETLFPVDYRREIQSRIRLLQTTQWDLSDSLWHVWLAPWGLPLAPTSSDLEHDGESLLIFRGHHALADGASIGAALMDLFDEAEGYRQQIVSHLRKRRGQAHTWLEQLAYKLKMAFWFLLSSLRALSYQSYLLCSTIVEPNPWSTLKRLSASTDAERTVAWTGPAALVDQVKWVASVLGGPKATVNDVFVSCVTAALAKQLAWHRKRLEVLSEETGLSQTLPKQRKMHISVPVHLKGGVVIPGESVGNNLGAFVVRVPGESDDNGVDRFVAVHRELNSVKRTPAAFLSHLMAKTLSYSSHVLPNRITSWIYARASAGSVAVVTNTRGPPQHVHLGGRRVETIYGFVPLPPGLPIGVVVSSYANQMNLTVTAEPWAVPDADQFLVWVLEEYVKLVKAAKVKCDQEASAV